MSHCVINVSVQFLQKNSMNRQEWLLWRRAGIGSSDAAAIMGVSPWSTPFELFLEKTGRIQGRKREPWEWKAMQKGIRMEPEARTSYENWTGAEMPPRCIIHPKYPQLRATLDGINFEVGRALEIKVPGEADHKIALTGKIPQKYLWQCVHILMVAELEYLDYWSYRSGEGVMVVLERNLFLERRLLKMELDFWKCVERDTPPELWKIS